MKTRKIAGLILACMLAGATMTSCKETESYSNLLNVENKATNWWLAQHRVEVEIPEDGNFKTGEDAPFYKMDKDGYLYMQVVNPGDPERKPVKGDLVYFRFMRLNLKSLYLGLETKPEGNADDMSNIIGATSFEYGNTLLLSTTKYGSGIQTPLDYLGYDCEVNLVIRSYYGFNTDQSQCIPYVYNVKYYKAEY